jgi:hypothetical protein
MSGWAKSEDPAPVRGAFISTTYSIVLLTHYCYSSSLISPPSLLHPQRHFVAKSAKVEIKVEDAVKTLPAVSSPQLPHSSSFSTRTHRFL